jgi:gliding motility-associated-like protein
MRRWLTILLTLFSQLAAGQNPWLVKDINSHNIVNQLSDGTTIGSDNSIIDSHSANKNDHAPPRMYNVNGVMLFFADNGTGGRGLWRTDGSAVGTYLVSTLGLSATDTLYISDNAYNTGKILYFENQNKTPTGTNGRALWRSDGTTAGTYAVFSGPSKRESSYSSSTNYAKLGAAVGDNFFFVGIEPNAVGDSLIRSIFKTDGTVGGTTVYQGLDTLLATNTFGVYGQFALENCMIGFNNKLMLSRNGQILTGDGVHPMVSLPPVPGSIYEVLNDWVNVNDQYLIISAYPSISAYESPDSAQIWRYNTSDVMPTLLANYSGAQGVPSFHRYGVEPTITNNRIFYYVTPGYPYQLNNISIGATDGTSSGTWIMNNNFPKGPRPVNQYGVTSSGLIIGAEYTTNVSDVPYYVWDGLSPTSYRQLTSLTDSLVTNGESVSGFMVSGDTILVLGLAHLYQSAFSNSYCYSVENVWFELPAPFNGGFIGFGTTTGTGAADAGEEPYYIRPFRKVWTGNVSADWNTDANWLDGLSPTASEDALIPNVKNIPVVTGTANCRNLIVNRANLTINADANLKVAGYVANYGLGSEYGNGQPQPTLGITGGGTLTRIGSYSNKTYGGGWYNMDSLNIDGNDLDLTNLASQYPSSNRINSVINFKSSNKLITNLSSLEMLKAPYFTGYDSARFIYLNRKHASLGYGDSTTPIEVGVYNASTAALTAVPVGSGPHDYSPLFFKGDPRYSTAGATLYLSDSVSYHGQASTFAGVVRKMWNDYPSNQQQIQLGWTSADEGPGFNHNSCYVAFWNGTTWIKGEVQEAILNKGVYTALLSNTYGVGYNTPLIVASDPCITSTVLQQPSDATVCPGTTVSFAVHGSGQVTYQWQLNTGNGWANLIDTGSYSGSATDSLSILSSTGTMNGYQFRCALLNSCSSATSSAASLIVQSQLIPSVTIQADTTNICSGTTVNFAATPVNSSTPSYQWKLNNANVGTNNASYSNDSLKNGDLVTCVMTAQAACVTATNFASNAIKITVSTVAPPSVTISANTDHICADSPVTFTATAINGGITPLYIWRINGVAKAETISYIVFRDLKDGDRIDCIMNSSSACGTNPPMNSNIIAISVAAPVRDSITISGPSGGACAGVALTFTATPVNGGSNPAYQWQVNGTNSGTNSPLFTSSNLADGDQVSCTMASNLGCVYPQGVTSNKIAVAISTVVQPSVSVATSASSICAQTPVTFTATAMNGGSQPSYQWQVNGGNTGTNSATFTSNRLNNGDIVTCVMTSNATCSSPASADTSVNITVNPLPAIAPISDITIQEGSNVRINPDVTGNIGRYQWTPPTGLSDATIANPEASPTATTTYWLTVTSTDGCTDSASLTIHVNSDLQIPNAFSPNGDGIHDQWLIPYLANLPNCIVDIFDRYGQRVFHSVGYGKPWDGSVNGNALPIATYYYVIDPKNGHKRVAGSVTILK